MRYVSIDSVEPGQFLGKTIYSGNGTVLLSGGVQLTVYMISTLNRIGVTMLYIQDPLFEDVETDDMLSEATKQGIIQEMSSAFEAIRSGKEWNTQMIGTSVENLLEDVIGNKELLVQLTDIQTSDNSQYIHAMNVCLLSSVMGINMGLNYQQLKELASGALLHDIGKSGMTEEDEILPGLRTHHTWRGFEKLKNKREFGLLVAHVALQHHERVDGAGLPRGLAGDEIHLYAKIVSAANTYDRLIHPALPEEKALLPHEACEEMMAMSEKQLDYEVLLQFNRIISIYPNGTAVRLSTRETGVVVRQHRGLPGRPVVRIVRGEAGNFDVKELDLAQETTVFIEAVLT
ncbi:HD domain-containing protein [Paenibacillus donghaensis]|uniref:HD-GYP domain-containing protein n=1 Tax=Paenibacillus donghaensis TaxID=414771 RepID=UPI0018841FC5|nr:HD domain-containing phosphohydrolase [Paenibacillus donghaensis]MBE9916274.1 HD domain-containing protein [Paenibacillus donghaensis]